MLVGESKIGWIRIIKKKERPGISVRKWVSLCMYAISIARQPWDSCTRVYHLFPTCFVSRMPARKGLLPADPASLPPRLPSCEKSRIPPAEMRKENVTRCILSTVHQSHPRIIFFLPFSLFLISFLSGWAFIMRALNVSSPTNELKIADAFLDPFVSLFSFGNIYYRIIHNKCYMR